jgi:uncharacterized protein (DUF4415 family)
MKRESIKVHLDADLLAWLREQAQIRRCSISQVIRSLIAEAVGKEETK